MRVDRVRRHVATARRFTINALAVVAAGLCGGATTAPAVAIAYVCARHGYLAGAITILVLWCLAALVTIAEIGRHFNYPYGGDKS